MKEKKMEIELSVISEETGHFHKVLDRVFVDELTVRATEEIEKEEMELA